MSIPPLLSATTHNSAEAVNCYTKITLSAHRSTLHVHVHVCTWGKYSNHDAYIHTYCIYICLGVYCTLIYNVQSTPKGYNNSETKVWMCEFPIATVSNTVHNALVYPSQNNISKSFVVVLPFIPAVCTYIFYRTLLFVTVDKDLPVGQKVVQNNYTTRNLV